MLLEPRQKILDIVSAHHHNLGEGESPAGVFGDDKIGELKKRVLVDHVQHLPHGVVGQRLAAERNDLVENALCIPHRTVALARDGEQRGVIGLDLLERADVPQLRDDVVDGDAPEIVALAAGDDGGGKLVGFGGRENEERMRRRFLQRFQQGVEGALGQHVHFVDDVHLVFLPARHETHRIADRADLLHPVVGSAVDLDDVDAASLGDLHAGVAAVAGLAVVRVRAVERLRENARGRGFPHAAWPREQVGVRDTSKPNRIQQRIDDVSLCDDFLECGRPVFPGSNEK